MSNTDPKNIPGLLDHRILLFPMMRRYNKDLVLCVRRRCDKEQPGYFETNSNLGDGLLFYVLKRNGENWELEGPEYVSKKEVRLVG